MKCIHCDEEIQPGEAHKIVKNAHFECGFRMIAGSVGHQQKKCSCYGGTMEDPEGMTLREAAKAAMEEFQRNNVTVVHDRGGGVSFAE